jgi:hypothetical protein
MEGKTRMFFLSRYLKKGKFPSAVIQGKKAGELEKGNTFKGNFQFHDIFSIS